MKHLQARTDNRHPAILIFLLLLMLSAPALYSEAGYFDLESRYYRLVSSRSHGITMQDLSDIDRQLESYNSYLRLMELPVSENSRFILRVFSSEEKIDTYLKSLGLEDAGGPVFILSIDNNIYELCFLENMFNSGIFMRHCFFQYFKSAVRNPPLWLLEGFSGYFEYKGYDLMKDRTYIPALKQFVSDNPGSIFLDKFENIFSVREVDKTDSLFIKLSWALIDYINSEKAPEKYRRFLWDSVKILEKNASAAENSALIRERAFRWIDKEELAYSLMDYILGKVTAAGMFDEGVDYYREGNYSQAADIFRKLSEYHPEAYYYAGISMYGKGNYESAEQYYLKALNAGHDRPAVLYALGLSSYASGDFVEAYKYFREAESSGREPYKSLSIEMIDKAEKAGLLE